MAFNNIDALFKYIKLASNIGFIALLAITLLIFSLDGIQAPIIGAILVVATLMVFLPYFYLKRQVQLVYNHQLNNLVIERYSDGNVNVELLIDETTIDNAKLFQKVDIVDVECVVNCNKSNYSIAIARISTFNYVKRINKHKVHKEGQRLPVFEGVFCIINNASIQCLENIHLLPTMFVKSKSPLSSLRLSDGLYENGKKVNISDNTFELFGSSHAANNYTNSVFMKNILGMSNIKNRALLSIQNGVFYLALPSADFLQPPIKACDLSKCIERDLSFTETLFKCIE